MTTLPGFNRPVDLYECANAHGVHVGSLDQLIRFGLEVQRRGAAQAALERMAANAESLGLNDEPTCWCQTCRPITMLDSRMVLCPTCGNKRCPHANDHRNECTGSNEPGQPGSAYPAIAAIEEEKEGAE